MGKSKVYDVIVIGAGASGLACADKLIQAGLDTLVLEGRNRVGGRAHTLHTTPNAEPIELGAEFIHGAPRSTLDYMKSFDLSFYDVSEERYLLKDSTLEKIPDFFGHLGKIMKKLTQDPKKDRTIQEFIKSHKSIKEPWKKLFASFVEGFHGADLNRMGENGLADTEETDDDSINETSLFRPVFGYATLFEKLSYRLKEHGALRFNMNVREIRWTPGKAEILVSTATGDEIFHARKVVISVPLGVLKSEHFKLNPFPKHLTPVFEHIEMGHVQKLVFRFQNRFWEDVCKKPVAFVHAGPDTYFPTWWTMLPMRSFHLVAWQGGPKALEMSLWSQEDRIKKALQTLSQWTQKPMSYLMKEMQSCDAHDWTLDPFSQGAYSYVKTGGQVYASHFSRPVKSTLYFAGEATRTGSTRGTVSGALDSGKRAALQILKDLSARNSQSSFHPELSSYR